MILKCKHATMERLHLSVGSYAKKTNPKGRYGVPIQGTVPAFSILNGV